MKNEKTPHILNASSNLLGICFIIVTGLKLTKASNNTLADEMSMFAALCFMGSCVFSYISMRSDTKAERYERVADTLFLAGLFVLFTAVLVFAYDLF